MRCVGAGAGRGLHVTFISPAWSRRCSYAVHPEPCCYTLKPACAAQARAQGADLRGTSISPGMNDIGVSNLIALNPACAAQARAQGADLRVTSISPGMVETEFAAVAGFGDAQGAAARYSEFKCLEVGYRL